MRILIFLTLASLLSACQGDKKKSPNEVSNPTPIPSKPDWAGNCDVDYYTLQIEKLSLNSVAIDDRGIDTASKIVHLNALNSLPDIYLKMLGNEHVPIRLINGGVSNFEELSSLKGKPVDSSNPDYTWDDLAGAMTAEGVFLGTTATGSNSVAIHEVGHVVDILVDLTSKSMNLPGIFQFYLENLPAGDAHQAYRMSNKYEFFAVGFDDYYCSEKSRNNLKVIYPKLFNYFESDIQIELSKLPIDKSVFDSQK